MKSKIKFLLGFSLSASLVFFPILISAIVISTKSAGIGYLKWDVFLTSFGSILAGAGSITSAIIMYCGIDNWRKTSGLEIKTKFLDEVWENYIELTEGLRISVYKTSNALSDLENVISKLNGDRINKENPRELIERFKAASSRILEIENSTLTETHQRLQVLLTKGTYLGFDKNQYQSLNSSINETRNILMDIENAINYLNKKTNSLELFDETSNKDEFHFVANEKNQIIERNFTRIKELIEYEYKNLVF